jgi:hypothetical protein
MKNTSITGAYVADYCDPTSLMVDHSYQRPIVGMAKRIVANGWDEVSAGAIYCARRSDGSLWILDGQQRAFAAVKLGLELVFVLIVESQGVEWEARKFVSMNAERSSVSRLSQFKAKLYARFPEAIEIDRLVAKFGLVIPDTGKRARWPFIKGITALETIHANDPGMIERVLHVSVKAWPENIEAIAEPMLLGLSLALPRTSLSTSEVIKRLRRKNPGRITREAKKNTSVGRERGKQVSTVLLGILD